MSPRIRQYCRFDFLLLGCCLSLLGALLPLGCEAPPDMEETLESQDGTPDDGADDSSKPREDAISMSGIQLYLHDTAPTGGQARKPRFMVEAARSSMESDNSWSFEEARAVLFNAETEEEDIVFHAGEGSFVENQEAYLGGGVEALAGHVNIQLQDIIYEQLETENEVVAYTENPVSIESPALELDAERMQIHAATRTMTFQEVSGWISFNSLNP